VSVTIVNGEAIDAAGTLPGETEQDGGPSTARKTKNHLLRRARLRQPSPSGSGLAMSRQELAEAVNAHAYAASGQVVRLNANYVGKLERGVARWPRSHLRAGLCAVLGAARSADLGFYITKDGVDPDPPEPDESAATTTAEQGPSLLRTILAERHWQVYRTFRVHFERAAQTLAGHEDDPTVRTLDVSERQFNRWLRGARPRPDACRVLESMFGHPIERLIGPADALPAMAADLEHFPHTAPERPVREADIGFVLSDVAASPAAVQVSVNAGAGAAVTVTCQDGAPGRIAVVAGAVRVLIDTSGVDAGVVDAPMVEGGARVYSLAERRAR
jgi:transcriptional regulator with XRE-family HTH domain